jgi:hypothetical protein
MLHHALPGLTTVVVPRALAGKRPAIAERRRRAERCLTIWYPS